MTPLDHKTVAVERRFLCRVSEQCTDLAEIGTVAPSKRRLHHGCCERVDVLIGVDADLGVFRHTGHMPDHQNDMRKRGSAHHCFRATSSLIKHKKHDQGERTPSLGHGLAIHDSWPQYGRIQTISRGVDLL